jgi:hypothetical protein
VTWVDELVERTEARLVADESCPELAPIFRDVIRETVGEAARRAMAATNYGDSTCSGAAARILAMLLGEP